MDNLPNRVEAIFALVKSNRATATVIVVGTFVIALASFTDALHTITSLWIGSPQHEARLKLSQLSLPFTAESFIDAASRNDLHAIKLYLAAGMDPNVEVPQYGSALQYAFTFRSRAMAAALYAAGAVTNLFEATELGKLDDSMYLKLALQNGMDEYTMLGVYRAAAGEAHFKHMLLLQKAGLDVARYGDYGLRAAAGKASHWGENIEECKLIIITYLLAKGIEVDASREWGHTALHYAAANAFAKITATLLERGADVNAVTKAGPQIAWNALTFATNRDETYSVTADEKKTIELLIHYGIAIDLADDEGRTPLMRAAQSRNAEIVEVLLNAGANPNLKDKYGHKAVDYLALNQHANKAQLRAILSASNSP